MNNIYIYVYIYMYIYIYRVFHNSVKYFKKSQQINYSTDHGSPYADRKRERETLRVLLHISQMLNVSTFGRTRLKRDVTNAEIRFSLSAKRTNPFKLAGGQFSRLLAAEVCASAVVMVVMLVTPRSEVECKNTDYPLLSHVSPSLPLPCVTVCHQVSTEL